ncbi:AMP-binding protein [Calditrichota bacterium]
MSTLNSKEKIIQIIEGTDSRLMDDNLSEIIFFLKNYVASPNKEDIEFCELLFSFIERPDIRESLAEDFEPNDFYMLGEKLLSESRSQFIESYFELFRSPKFLTKIYDDDRWSNLILKLLRKANYTFSKLFNHRIRNYPYKTLFTILESDSQKDITWTEVQENVSALTKGLYFLLGENSSSKKIAFLCENSIEMVYFDLACLAGGIVNVMIPANSVPTQIEYILTITKPAILVVSHKILLYKLITFRKNLDFLKKIVIFSEPDLWEDDYVSIKQVKEFGQNVSDSDILNITNRVKLKDLASIMFTSGTTGHPKGIMFSHQNIVFKRFARAMAIPKIGEQDIFLSYLPLYHTFGRWLEMTGSIFWNARYVFMENPSVEAMMDNMKRIRPSIFISIPKKWYQLYERIGQKVDLEHDVDAKIIKAIENVTGGSLKWGLSAAGHLDSEIFQFFQRYGIELMSGFGMTEATGGITMTPPGKYIPNSLGKELPGIQLKLAKDGELLIKGPYVMMGYFNPEGSEEEFINGWLPTGDVMQRDSNGFIEIVDRKKEIYKNIKGETIAPQKIENLFAEFEFIKNVFLVGDHKYYNTLLIYPNYKSAQVNFNIMDQNEIHDYFSSVIVSVNQFLAAFERIVDYRVIDREFDAGKGELTPKGTYRRLTIEKNFENIIAPMYGKNYTSLLSDELEIRVPNWFLRNQGITANEITIKQNIIHLKNKKWDLIIKRLEKDIQIGQHLVSINKNYLDFGVILNSPLLWLGNEQLVNFTGENIFKWMRIEDDLDGIRFKGLAEQNNEKYSIKEQLQTLLYKKENSLFGIHLSAIGLSSRSYDEGKLAVEYLEKVAKEKKLDIASTAVEILKRSYIISNINIQRMAFCSLVDLVNDTVFLDTARLFIDSDTYFVNPDIINIIEKKNLSDDKLRAFTDLTQYYVELKNMRCVPLFSLLEKYGARHPAKFKMLRQCLVQSQLSTDDEKIQKTARKARLDMRSGFREWLGSVQHVAVDTETGDEYSWDDVIIFEEGIEKKDKEKMLEAIKNTTLIKEAIFLFSKGIQLQLDGIPPGGVWISLLGKEHGKSVYRVSIQTRFQGSYDFALNINSKLEYDQIVEEIVWLISSGTVYEGKKLVEDFGGFWKDFDLWTEEFIHGKTVGKFLNLISRQKKEANYKRAQLLWPYFIWSGVSAYIDFWQRTGRRLEVEDPSIENVIIPPHDYQTGSRIVSIAARKKHQNVLDMLVNFHKKFVDPAEKQYPFLNGVNKWKYIFSAFPDTFGVERGLDVLRNCCSKIEEYKDDPFYGNLKNELHNYSEKIAAEGFIPKNLYFAIRRYHRWFVLNNNATIQARAATLSELFSTYSLHQLEEVYPETRTIFFMKTVFENAKPDLLERLNPLVNDLKNKKISINDLSLLFSSIQKQVKIDEKEMFFLTRLSFPHIRPEDSAEMITLDSGGESKANLVVHCEDLDGNHFIIREPVNPKEIAKLHQLFVSNRLQVQFRPEHQYLIAVNERGYLIGGIYYFKTEDRISHLEKIVVDSYYRKKGVSDLMMKEFFKRNKNMNVDVITTGFFRPEYFYRFGFKIERKYAGLVKDLSEIDFDSLIDEE